MTRTLFPDLKLFKKTVTEHFLVALREIYKIHPAYPYQEEESAETKIHVEPTYANISYEGLNPQLLVKVGQYDFGLQDTLGKNVFSEIKNDLNVIAGFRSLKNMSTIITVAVKAYAEEESADIADELALLGVYAAHHMFTQVGINILGSSVSDTIKVDNHNDIFQTIVNFQVNVPWELSKTNNQEAVNPSPDIDIPPDFYKTYREPGVYVYPKSKNN